MDELNIRSLSAINHAMHWIDLTNETNKSISSQQLAEDFSCIDGLEQVKLLTIGWRSQVEDLLFLQAFPSVEKLMLYGKKLRTLDGLQWFKHGQAINIDTGANRRRNIARIAETHITALELRWANADDFAAIRRCATLHYLLLASSPCVPFDCWHEVPLETVQLFGGSFEELAGTAYLKSLRVLTCKSCRKLARFAGDNSNVTWMTVEGCHTLDISTLATFSNLESLQLVSLRQAVPLSIGTLLPKLKNLSLLDCNVHIDNCKLQRAAIELETLTILGIEKDRLLEISLRNPGVIVRNNRFTFRDGCPVESA